MDTTNNRFYREPAFPSTTKTYTADDGDTMHQGANGMTLRDYFAAKAMVALINNEFCAQGINEIVASGKATRDDLIAAVAYTQADAMLRARGEA
ncbi:hypothetical protein [Burkholderia pseudomallei]|uniref:hypothetical protein n=1 Tax=Burkholderia pseudomallei TaxID=28450 RepID=UPI00097566AE|nr:hypothetical protein [Burkholderia pseudomallei]ONE22454.1 hypothetical protein AQ946_23555 [Burkholderia pseudomallei]ONE31415.1 hypothetical protein AQ948_25105 [Burkholderia pseudomallei]ONE37948.1 hypothetical protein AQ947_16215 [Burkholderia pseudomallei]CAJ2860095.1 gp38 [Burkholderia pseudomallei]CAJ2930909.1 gp38 [Burkholderia pseudomallei]